MERLVICRFAGIRIAGFRYAGSRVAERPQDACLGNVVKRSQCLGRIAALARSRSRASRSSDVRSS